MSQAMSFIYAQPEPAPDSGPARAAMDEAGRLEALRATIARIIGRADENEFLTKTFNNLDWKAEVLQKPELRIFLGENGHFDRLLGGALRLGTLTEILAACPGDAAAASGFLLGLAARLAARPEKAKAAIVWIGEEFSCREQGELYGPGLALHGLDPTRLVLVQAQTAQEALWAMEEALKCPAPAVVIGELWSAKPYDLVASRRLLLAARRHGTPALLFLPGLPGGADHLSSGADLRFEIRAHPSVHPPSAGALPLPGAAAWSVRIAKARLEARAEGGGLDREKFHHVFWDHEEALLRDAVPLALASFSRDRSDRPTLARG